MPDISLNLVLKHRKERVMSNRYLDIEVFDYGYIRINSNDGVFSSITTVAGEEKFYAYCDEKAEMWLTSKLGNFKGWSDEDRKVIANKWLKAKELSEGEYKYYFNLENIKDIFRQEVTELANSMGIKDFTLEINE